MKRAALLLPVVLAGCMPAATPPRGPIPARPARVRPSRHAAAPLVTVRPPLAALVNDSRTPTLARAMQAAGLMPLLDAPGPLTLFAPTEEAWSRLAPGVAATLLRPENRPSLAALLRFHLVPGRVTSADLRRRAATGPVRLPTLAGEPLTVTLTGDVLTLADASGHRAYVIDTDQPAGNGIVQQINGLLVPQSLGPQP